MVYTKELTVLSTVVTVLSTVVHRERDPVDCTNEAKYHKIQLP